MPNPHIYAALAHERHQTFLAQAENDRRARQARLHRRQAGTPDARRSPLRRRPAWLRGVTGTRQTKARRGADRARQYDTYSGWAQRRAGAAGLAVSSGSRMKAVVRRAKYRIVLRGRDRSAATRSMARGGPEAEGVSE
jgi:hypothetical protein